MTDKLDHILSDYFTGRLDANIKASELVKQFGQAINQRHLDMWLFQRHVIGSVLQLESEQHIKTFRARYGNHDSWMTSLLKQVLISVRVSGGEIVLKIN